MFSTLFWTAVLIFSTLSFVHWWLVRKSMTYQGKPMPLMKGSVPIFFNLPIIAYHALYVGDFYNFMDENFKKLGRVFAFHRPMGAAIIVLNDADLLHELMAGQRTNQTMRRADLALKNMHDLLGDGIFNTEEHWEEERKMMSRMFNVRELNAYQDEVFFAHGEILLDVLRKDIGNVIDLQDLAMRYTLDTGMNIFYGEKSDSLSLGTTSYSSAFNSALLACNSRVSLFFWKWLPTTWLPSEVRLANSLKLLNNFFYGTIDRRLQDPNLDKKRDLLSLYIRHALSKNDNNRSLDTATRVKLRDMMANVLIAARDTTAMSFIFTIYLLSTNPRVLAEVETEIAKLSAQIKDSSEKSDTFNILRKSNYLKAVVYESLRLYPSVPFDALQVDEPVIHLRGSKNSNEGPALTLRKGEVVQYSAKLMGRDAGYWGADVDEFRPERWLEEDAQQQGKPPFVPWNLGRRLCLGKEFSVTELKTMLFLVVPEFDFELVEEFHAVPAVTVLLEKGMKVKVLLKKKN